MNLCVMDSNISEELQELMNQQKQIRIWLTKVQNRIYELETTYLEDTSLGNIIKGWEIDGRPLLKKQCEDKERLFSFSSYQVWSDHKIQQEIAGALKLSNAAKQKKPVPTKKRKVEVMEQDWNQAGDY